MTHKAVTFDMLTKVDLLDALHSKGFLSQVNLQVLRDFTTRWGMRSYDAIVEANVLSESNLADAISDCYELSRAYGVRTQAIGYDILKSIAFDHALQLAILVRSLAEAGPAQAIVADPTDVRTIQVLRTALGDQIVLYVAERSDIVAAVHELYPLANQIYRDASDNEGFAGGGISAGSAVSQNTPASAIKDL